MALTQMPNGEVVDIADGTPPDVIAKIKAQYSGTRKDRVAAGQPRANAEKPKGNLERGNEALDSGLLGGFRKYTGALQEGLLSGVTAGFKDELYGGIAKLLGTGDYKANRDDMRAVDRQAQEDAPLGYTAADLAGSLAIPITGEGRLLGKAGEVASKVGLRGVGGMATRGAEKLAASGVLPKAIIAGAEQGALNAAGHSEEFSDMPSSALLGAGIGGATGGVIGGGINLAQKAGQILKDRGAKYAERKAYERVGGLLENGGMAPQDARLELLLGDAAGGNGMVADLTPGLRAEAVQLARKPSLPSSNSLIDRATSRIEKRNARFADQARTDAGMPDDLNALARSEEINMAKDNIAKGGYAKGGPLDTQLNHTDEMDHFFDTSPDADRLIKKAYITAQRHGDPIGHVDDVITPTSTSQRIDPVTGTPMEPMKVETSSSKQAIPSYRVFDYLKREFDGEIGAALAKGDRTTAEGLSNHLKELKRMLGEANPEYKALLKAQRDEYQKLSAMEQGQGYLTRLQKGGIEARKVASEIRSLPHGNAEDARIGIIDALVNMDSKANPVGMFHAMTRNPHQRQVLEFAFGGKAELDRFSRWIRRERRAQAVDNANAPGNQSITSTAEMAAMDAEDGGAGSKVMQRAASGFFFGGGGGAVMNALRTAGDFASKPSKPTQEAIAKVLLSKGEGLQKGVREAKEFGERRAARNLRRARGASRIAADYYTNIGGG